ncbi:MAG: leucyl aminopeptidase family protein [Leptolyngbyaceae cyanobacterium MO_188.B28]|nr:leucyl aminopeptidase family protein [Leptolyngbyaceae cyanobacterium MO_188.B28]
MSDAVPIFLVDEAALKSQHSAHEAWLTVSRFKAKAGASCLIPGSDGRLEKVLVGKPDPLDTWTLGKAAQSLPPCRYYLADALTDEAATKLCLGWKLGQYQFSKYKQKEQPPLPELTFPDNVDRDYVEAVAASTFLVRDLINTPANDMGPQQLEECARTLAETHQADLQVISGTDLTAQQYPLIYAVGKASEQAPRLLDLKWGDETAPKVTLVGKGVCFDSGGLDVKSASGMKMMKKDMGGAAQVLGLAHLIMRLKLPVRLRVLTPAVENSIAGNAMRPLDVLPSRKGITVEVGNTDAEGRLVLADALWEACSETPKLLIDCATLTGAARVALGTEMPVFFCSHPATATALQQSGQETDDLLWQLPLNQAYRSMLDSKVADISNISSAMYGGAITAALFLQEFVKSDIPWVHVDLMGWNLRSLPGRPEGGEAMGMRALFELIRRVLT